MDIKISEALLKIRDNFALIRKHIRCYRGNCEKSAFFFILNKDMSSFHFVFRGISTDEYDRLSPLHDSFSFSHVINSSLPNVDWVFQCPVGSCSKHRSGRTESFFPVSLIFKKKFEDLHRSMTVLQDLFPWTILSRKFFPDFLPVTFSSLLIQLRLWIELIMKT